MKPIPEVAQIPLIQYLVQVFADRTSVAMGRCLRDTTPKASVSVEVARKVTAVVH